VVFLLLLEVLDVVLLTLQLARDVLDPLVHVLLGGSTNVEEFGKQRIFS
jgi:hypothetical protein